MEDSNVSRPDIPAWRKNAERKKTKDTQGSEEEHTEPSETEGSEAATHTDDAADIGRTAVTDEIYINNVRAFAAVLEGRAPRKDSPNRGNDGPDNCA